MTTIRVAGMHCAHCDMLVTMELEDRGAKNVVSNHETGVVTFEGDLTPAQVKEAVEAAGFSVA